MDQVGLLRILTADVVEQIYSQKPEDEKTARRRPVALRAYRRYRMVKHPLGIFERERDLAFEGFASISPACGILGASEEARHIIRANNDLGHGFFPRVLFTISSHSC
jgi:hypothetical protein